MLSLSKTQILRAAEETIARQQHAREAPAVIWADLDEAPEEFAQRCAQLQQSGARRVLAAVPYGYPVRPGVEAVEFPEKHFRLLHPSVWSRYRIGSGGRGSAKSHSFATAIILRMLMKRMRVLCAREIQRSLRESVHKLLSDKIERLKLSAYFDINEREIACRVTNSEVIFAGLMTNVQQLKSLEGVDLCWIEEGESVSQRSFEILPPTIRNSGSEIWISLNPDAIDAPVMSYIDSGRNDVRHEHADFSDNPWFPAELDGERIQCQRTDPDLYAHIWLGMTRTFSDAQVFKGKYEICQFEPVAGWNGPYFGADWGFAVDPTALVKAWIFNRVLYIEYEAFGFGTDIDKLPNLFDTVPGARLHTIRADNARPETISYMHGHQYRNVLACEKWKGSVEDGVAHLRSYEKIVIHPRCKHIAEEFRLYSFRVDRLTGDVMPDLLDKHNHGVDALRYALQPRIQRRRRAEFTNIDFMNR